MQSAFPVQELPVRSALTVEVNCVNRTRKHAASVTAYSVLRACPSIQCSTRSQRTGNVGSEKGLKQAKGPQFIVSNGTSLFLLPFFNRLRVYRLLLLRQSVHKPVDLHLRFEQ